MHSFDAWFDAHPPRYGQTHRNVAFFAWTAARKCQGGLVTDICRAYEQGKAGTYAAYPLGSIEHNAYKHGVSVAADARKAMLEQQLGGDTAAEAMNNETNGNDHS